MAGFKDNALERRNASVAAKQALLDKFKSQPAPDDPTLQQRVEERKAIADAREIRMAERRRTQEIEAVRQAELRAVAEAEKQVQEEEERKREADQVMAEERKREERKLARDARYAARKARIRGR